MACLTLIAATAWPAAAASNLYRVHRVEDWDVLYIREKPDPNSADLGSIPPDGRCVRALGQSEMYQKYKWILIEYQGGRGWVNSHFLTPDKGSCPGNAAPADRIDHQAAQPAASPAKFMYTNSLGMQFALLPSGWFKMGSPEDEPGRGRGGVDETGPETVIGRAFYFQTTEVTQGQWRLVMGNNPSRFYQCGDDCPVENVSYNEVLEFIGRLNTLEKTTKYRLPTEAEWEYACRAGTTTATAGGPLSDTACGPDPALSPLAWYCPQRRRHHSPHGPKRTQRLGPVRPARQRVRMVLGLVRPVLVDQGRGPGRAFGRRPESGSRRRVPQRSPALPLRRTSPRRPGLPRRGPGLPPGPGPIAHQAPHRRQVRNY